MADLPVTPRRVELLKLVKSLNVYRSTWFPYDSRAAGGTRKVTAEMDKMMSVAWVDFHESTPSSHLRYYRLTAIGEAILSDAEKRD